MKIKNNSKNLLVLSKPKNYIVTRSDELGRKTVYNLLPDWVFNDGWMPIGRLDLESKGLLLFTQNGKIGNFLTKPGNCIKTYEILIRGYVTEEHINMALKGVKTSTGILKALTIDKIGNAGAKTKLRIQINEGKNRHIRKLFGTMKDPKFNTALKVLKLTRISIGNFKLDIKSGEWRFLSEKEEKLLLKDF